MKYVALLRGINVGGNSTVDMQRLKKCFESLGYENVRTYINSGNVIFDTVEKKLTEHVDAIEKNLKQTFDFDIHLVVRDQKNIERLCEAIPAMWTNGTEQKTDVLFLWEEYDSRKSLKLIHANPSVDALVYVAGAIVWNLHRSNYAKSGMSKLLSTELYKKMTARNVNTVRKLAALMNLR